MNQTTHKEQMEKKQPDHPCVKNSPGAPDTVYKRRGLIGEFWGYLMENKVWWMVPIIIVFLLMTILFIFGSTALAPFIYPLF